MGKKKHRPKSKAELLREQLERERPRPPRPAAGWLQRAAERSNKALAELILEQERERLKEDARKLIEEEARRIEEGGGTGEAFSTPGEALDNAAALLPDAGREGPAIGGL